MFSSRQSIWILEKNLDDKSTFRMCKIFSKLLVLEKYVDVNTDVPSASNPISGNFNDVQPVETSNDYFGVWFS